MDNSNQRSIIQSTLPELHLGAGVFVDESLNYEERANELIRKCVKCKVGNREEGYTDDKCLVTLDGMEALIGAGARIRSLNKPSGDLTNGGSYYECNVRYRDRTFIYISHSPEPFTINPQLTH
ncbi:MAG: hypothetical protein AABW79_02615 [Nanoarchaeota archaeon]